MKVLAVLAGLVALSTYIMGAPIIDPATAVSIGIGSGFALEIPGIAALAIPTSGLVLGKALLLKKLFLANLLGQRQGQGQQQQQAADRPQNYDYSNQAVNDGYSNNYYGQPNYQDTANYGNTNANYGNTNANSGTTNTAANYGTSQTSSNYGNNNYVNTVDTGSNYNSGSSYGT